MDSNLKWITTEIYDKCSFKISDFKTETEGKGYYACQFKLNEYNILSRNGRITPRKTGQFLTCWKRSKTGTTEPFNENDLIDSYIVNVQAGDKAGQFVFPKALLVNKGILGTVKKEGKRGFRVYPKWDNPTSQQARRTQKWQLDYFYEINSDTDINKVLDLYTM